MLPLCLVRHHGCIEPAFLLACRGRPFQPLPPGERRMLSVKFPEQPQQTAGKPWALSVGCSRCICICAELLLLPRASMNLPWWQECLAAAELHDANVLQRRKPKSAASSCDQTANCGRPSLRTAAVGSRLRRPASTCTLPTIAPGKFRKASWSHNVAALQRRLDQIDRLWSPLLVHACAPGALSAAKASGSGRRCHRVALTRAVLGLEDAVTMDVLFYRRDPDRGWQFKPEVRASTAAITWVDEWGRADGKAAEVVPCTSRLCFSVRAARCMMSQPDVGRWH
jgi:hypothetical protein